MINQDRTPFVQQAGTGEWILILPAGLELEWGHRFDKDFGYRVFLKFTTTQKANCMPAATAIEWARKISRNEDRAEILTVAKALVDMAQQVARLNKAWADAGAPELPLDQIGTPAHA